MGQYFLFCSCRVIVLAYCFGKFRRSPTIIGVLSLLLFAMENDLMHASGHSPSYKIEERTNFALSHAHLYLSESYDEQNNKSAAANTFYISCSGGESSSSLSSITVYLSATSDVFCCWIFTSYLFLPNDPLPSDDMVDWENDSILGIGGGDTNIDKGSFVLHNSW